MSKWAILGIAFALTVDTFAVSVSSGVAIRNMRVRHALLIAGFFAGAQALMPLIGWLVGRQILAYVAGVDHWVAFGLLLFVGAKMIWESRFQEKSEKVSDPLNVYVLFVLAVATSIDALAVGLSLCMVKVDIVTPVLIIGGVTFAVSFAGAYAGALAGHLFEIQLEIFGGIVLIGLGLKILVEHLLAA